MDLPHITQSSSATSQWNHYDRTVRERDRRQPRRTVDDRRDNHDARIGDCGHRAARGLNLPPLVIAVRNRDASSLRLLIQYGAKIPAIEPETGDPLLHYAVEHNAVDVIRVLLESHVDVNTAADDGMTALHRAPLEDNPELVELLLKYGSDPNAKSQGRKPRDMAWEPAMIAIFDRFQRTK